MKNKPYLHKDFIDQRALEIVETLQKKRFATYLVGGCVRDLLLGLQPKDFDIGTIAHPPQVKRTVPNSYIIGKRFRLVLAKRNDDMFEIATFRRDTTDEGDDDTLDENAYGTAEEDAKRRDFTINALFYDPFEEKLIDYNQGLDDLQRGYVRMIGEPVQRLKEDPVRILRAIRLAHKIQFSIEPNLRQAIRDTAEALAESALPRRREEYLKFLRLDDPSKPFIEAYDLGVLKHVAPLLHEVFSDPETARSFAYRLRNYEHFQFDLSDNSTLFAGVVHAYYRSMIQPSLEKTPSTKDLKTHEKLKSLMRDELGMFNYEQDRCLKALHMQKTLQNWEEYERRGDRRRQAVFQNESFPLGLIYCELDQCLPDDAWSFWLEGYETFLPELMKRDLEKGDSNGFGRKKRNKSNRNRRRKPFKKPQ
ncbi:MAG: poly(A) polymerase [Bdellovibrionales bacterium]